MRRNTLALGAVLVFLVPLLSGCGWITGQLIKSSQSQFAAELEEATFGFVRSDDKAFERCMTTWGGTCDGRTEGAKTSEFVQPVKAFREFFGSSQVSLVPGLSDITTEATSSPAVRVLESSTLEKFIDIFNFVAGQPESNLSATKSDRNVLVFQFTPNELRNFSKDIGDAVRFGAFQTSYEKLDQETKKLKSKTGLSEAQESHLANLEMCTKMTAYIVSYMKAYFRNGEFASIVLDPTKLKEAIKNRLETLFPGLVIDPSELEKLANKLAQGLPLVDGKYRLIGRICETSFKTRAGADYKFPAITATLTPGSREFITVSKVDYVAVGGELIRVFLEAVGDALAGVPGVTGATGCKLEGMPDAKDLGLRVFNPDDPATKLKMEEFENVNEYANKVEGVVSAVTGRVIRGLNWFSLNNESLAVLIETAVGVMAKKASEKVIWCGYCVAPKEGATTIVPHGIGRRQGETIVSARFELVEKERLVK